MKKIALVHKDQSPLHGLFVWTSFSKITCRTWHIITYIVYCINTKAKYVFRSHYIFKFQNKRHTVFEQVGNFINLSHWQKIYKMNTSSPKDQNIKRWINITGVPLVEVRVPGKMTFILRHRHTTLMLILIRLRILWNRLNIWVNVVSGVV